MDICSPKDGFVLKILRHVGDAVDTDTVVIQMDTEVEDRALKHLEAMEKARKVRAQQYTGESLQRLRDLAQLAVDTAKSKTVAQDRAYLETKKLFDLGTAQTLVYIDARESKNQTDQALAKALQ